MEKISDKEMEDTELLEELKSHPELLEEKVDFQTPLLSAAWHGSLPLVIGILSLGANIEAVDHVSFFKQACSIVVNSYYPWQL